VQVQPSHISALPRFRQRAGEIQSYGTENYALPLELEEPLRLIRWICISWLF